MKYFRAFKIAGLKSGESCDDAEPFLVPYPKKPLESVYSEHSRLRSLQSKHTRDLLLIFISIIGGAFFVSILILNNSDAHITKISTAIVSSSLAAIGAIYHLAKTRFATVDLFSSQILAKMRVLAADNTIEEILKYTNESTINKYRITSKGEMLRSYDAISPSEESHFELFHRRSSDLGILNRSIVDHATDFYNFHMAARDQLRELKAAIDNFPEERSLISRQVLDVIFMIDLMAFSAHGALNELIENKPHNWHSSQVVLCVATQANSYLMSSMTNTDFRYSEVQYRHQVYVSLAKKLRKNIKNKYYGRFRAPMGGEYF